ncbi:MAG: plasmid recombination protein [Clostridiales bacterium]|nr:plasmid recombination protein [Clostridiales bacterium]
MYDSATGTEQGELCKVILDEYMRDFEKRNPNLYVFNAVLHCDECTPHLHIDYIPLGRDYKQGMAVRNSLDRALKQQGIDGKSNKRENSTIAWQQSEKSALETIMNRHGIERAAETGLHLKNQSVNQYKAVAHDTDNRLKQLAQQIEYKPAFLNKDKVVVNAADIEKIEEKAKLLVIKEDAVKSAEAKQKGELSKISEYKHYKSESEKYKTESAEYKKKYEEKAEAYDKMTQKFDEVRESHFKAIERNLNLRRGYSKALETLTALISSAAELSRAVNAVIKTKDLSAEVKAALKVAAAFLKKSISDLPALENKDFERESAFKEYKKTKNTIDTSTTEISQEISTLYSSALAKVNEKYPPVLTYKGGSQGRGFYEIHNGTVGKFYGGKEILPELLENGVKIKDPYSLLSRSKTK